MRINTIRFNDAQAAARAAGEAEYKRKVLVRLKTWKSQHLSGWHREDLAEVIALVKEIEDMAYQRGENQ